MNYLLVDFECENDNDLVSSIKKIPSDATFIDFRGHYLGNKANLTLSLVVEELKTRGVTGIGLRDNNLGTKPEEELAVFFRSLEGIKTLDLRGNQFNQFDYSALIRLFKEIPPGLTSLYLGHNGLSRVITINLITEFKNILPTVISFDVNNQYRNKTAEELHKMFKELPDSETVLNLEDCQLSQKTGEQLAIAFRGIPKSVTSLLLGFNNLYSKSGDELAQAFSAIPNNIITLDLAYSKFCETAVGECVKAFQAIPRSIISLNLRGNSFGVKTGEELVEIFKAIPSSVTSLDLSSNDLGKMSADDLIKVFSAIPSGVTSLNLRGNNFSNRTKKELSEIFKAIPPEVISLNLKDNGIDETQYYKYLIAREKNDTSPNINIGMSGVEHF